jgi:hypothetical protein
MRTLREDRVNTTIGLFLAFGALFGHITYANRHLFSEGPARRPEEGERDATDSRWLWMAICSCLWPLFTMTGLYALWRRSRVRVPRDPRS